MKRTTTLRITLFFSIIIVLSSCKKDINNNNDNNAGGPSDTLSGVWTAESPNMYSNKGFQEVFELDNQIFTLNQTYPGNPAQVYKYTPQASSFTPFYTFTGNVPYNSYCQNGNIVYCMIDYTSSTGGFNAVYDFKYSLYRISSQSVTKIADVHNPNNISLSSHKVFTQNNDVYFAGRSIIPGTNETGITVFKLMGDSLKLISSKPSTINGTELFNIPNGGAYIVQYALINGEYTNLNLLKIDQGQITTVKSGLYVNGILTSFGGNIYNLVKVPQTQTPEYIDVYLENIETSQRKTISKIVSYIKYQKVRDDKLYIVIASQNHTHDNHFVVVNPNGKINYFPLFKSTDQFKQIEYFGEGESKYYVVVSNIMENVLYSFPK